MSVTSYNEQQTIRVVPRITRKMPFLPKLILENWMLHRELERIKYRISELEDRVPGEEVIIMKNITREEARGEICQLFSTGRTLYYSDIVEELQLDPDLVVDICDELQEKEEIGVDERVAKKVL